MHYSKVYFVNPRHQRSNIGLLLSLAAPLQDFNLSPYHRLRLLRSNASNIYSISEIKLNLAGVGIMSSNTLNRRQAQTETQTQTQTQDRTRTQSVVIQSEAWDLLRVTND